MLGNHSISFRTKKLIVHRVDVARDREIEGDLVQGDIGYGMPFRPGSFDGAIR